ncbi:MAG: HAMP domain-containing histidine kinase [Ruminococcus sp.]|nr:HAMP domain-containing histidine kinase [Ruminococcus sp.]MDE6797099.1 HAMP domain-containing histidine kinase [Ruminococcus sp.]
MPLRLKIWIHFVVFILLMFVLMWIFQIFFLESFYESMKTRSVTENAVEIVESYENEYKDGNRTDFINKYSEVAVNNDVCVEILDKYGRSIYSKDVLGECLVHGKENRTYKFLNEIRRIEEPEALYKVSNPKNSGDMLVYICVLGSVRSPEGYLLINSELAPVGSTVSIIKRQMFIITIILIFIAAIISVFLADIISRPIDRITKSAENMAKGDLNTQFDGRGYLEAQKLADTLMYAEKELSRVDTMQRDLIANVSHDLRTPLTMLKAYAEMIRDLSGDNPVKRNEHLEIIINETDRLSAMVNDILDLSKLESGKQKMNPTEFEISSKMKDIIGRFKGVSEKMGYHIHFTPDTERIVCCDVGKIEQVIYNLINNAINYTGDDKQVYVRQINQPDGVLIEIEDTGDGIEEDKIKLIFDKYYRSENHKREVVGTGLGLSIVKVILKLHGYDYGVRSTLGKGSVFWFRINGGKNL